MEHISVPVFENDRQDPTNRLSEANRFRLLKQNHGRAHPLSTQNAKRPQT